MVTKTLFITGGSGYIGSQVISTFLSAGYTVTALARSDESAAHLRSLGATPVSGDLKTLSVLTLRLLMLLRGSLARCCLLSASPSTTRRRRPWPRDSRGAGSR
jgi:nucleoside-diphosphate-sugar epimerase